jgi:hypothetical protein
MSNTGGPAFPAPSGWDSQGNWCRNYTDSEGMTLRDYFAAKAMQSFAVHEATMQWSNDRLATEAYDLADAMLKAREA